jgi:tRNA dimethylallyltransferase
LKTAHRPLVLALIGPTAVGKTDVAVELVKRSPLDIISVDSAMVYRGMDIGTAKPDAALRAVAPHRLIDLCDPAEPYSAARFRDDALREIAAITAAGRTPLLVGGTMLYFRALEQGLSGLPGADPDTRRRIEAEGRALGWPALHARLAARDPAAGRRIHPNDPQRIQRALEVLELTGRPMSDQIGRDYAEPLPFEMVKLHIMPDNRGLLHARISERFHRMLEAGLLREVETLFKRGDLDPGLPSVRAVGYRQLWRHLSGESSYAAAVEQAITETRRLAKRQMTWMRSDTAAVRFEGYGPESTDRILKYVADVTHY